MVRRRVTNWRYLEIVSVAVVISILALTPAANPVAQSVGRRCDDAYCYETICTPVPPTCHYVSNRVCKPTTKEECTTHNVRKCQKVPHTVCNAQSGNSCRPHLKQVCGPSSAGPGGGGTPDNPPSKGYQPSSGDASDTPRYRTYAAEALGHSWRIPHLRPRRTVFARRPSYTPQYKAIRPPAYTPRPKSLPPLTPKYTERPNRGSTSTPPPKSLPPSTDKPIRSPMYTCHLQVVRECSNAPKQVCHQEYKDDCRDVPERSCHQRETQDCHDEPKYVCERGQEKCEPRVQRVPAHDLPSRPDGLEKVPAPHKEAKLKEPHKEVTPPPTEDIKPSQPSPPVASPPSTSPERADPGQPAPRTAAGDRPAWARELRIDTRAVMAPLAAGLAAFGMLLLFLGSRRRKSQANDDDARRQSEAKDLSRLPDVDIAYRGKPDPGRQHVSLLPPIGPRITLRTVAGSPLVNITMGRGHPGRSR